MKYCKDLDVAICNEQSCRCAVEMESVVKHLRQTHGVESEAARGVLDDLKDVRGKCEGVGGMRGVYLDGDRSVGKVPRIAELPVVKCLKCRQCSYMSVNKDTLRKHCQKCWKEGGGGPTECLGQSVFGGNKVSYFEVEEVDAERCEIGKRMVELQGCVPSRVQGEDISRMDPYLAEMRFDLHLKRLGVELGDALDLASFRSEGQMESKLRHTIRAYMKRSLDIFMRKVHVGSHSLLDSRIRLCLKPETIRRYETRLSRFLEFLIRAKNRGMGFIRGSLKEKILELERALGVGAEVVVCMEELHRVVWVVMFEVYDDEEQALPAFLACSSVVEGRCVGGKTTCRFGTAAETSPMLAALKYCAQCIVVTEVYAYNEPGERQKAWEGISQLTSGTADTGVMVLSYFMKKSNQIRHGDIAPVRVVVCPHHAKCCIVEGVEMSLGGFGERMRKLQRDSWELVDSILHGFPIGREFWEYCGGLRDNLGDRTPGYWFGMHPANYKEMNKLRKMYLSVMKGVLFDKDGEPRRAECRKYLDWCEQLQKKIVALLQTCSGGPGRATEVGVLQVCNTAEASRHIFISKGQVFIMCSYHKGRSMNEGVGKPVARFPDSVTSGILLVYLLIIRAVEVVVVDRHVMITSESTEHRDFLFACRGVCAKAPALREWFYSSMQSVGVEFHVNRYRHFLSGVAKHFLSVNEDESEEGGDMSMLHRQMGHTEGTGHRIYGVAMVDMRSMTGTQLEAFRTSSAVWVGAIGMKLASPCRELERVDREGATRRGGRDKCEGCKTTSSRLDRIEELLEKLVGVAGTHENGSGRKRERELVEVGAPRKAARRSVGEILRQMLSRPNASFRSEEQEKAVECAFDGEEDALVVLPTGVGKSMTFMLAAYGREGKVCIVVVPLVALQDDLKSRCSEAGLNAEKWAGRDGAGVNIVLVSVEHIRSPEYRDYVRELYALGRLHCIFVDEAHLLVSWASFRSAMEDVGRHIRPSGVTVPVMALTATCPPGMEHVVARRCGMEAGFKAIRSSTSRRNIRYGMKKYDGDLIWGVCDVVREMVQRHEDVTSRFIVYCPTIELCVRLNTVMETMFPDITSMLYYGELEESRRKQCMEEWCKEERVRKIMICTSAFGCGVDMPNIRVVLHAGTPGRLIDFIQESGRAGRDGDVAESIVLLTRVHVKCSAEEKRLYGTMEVFLNSRKCRRKELDRYADGATVERSCAERGMEECDNCSLNKEGGGGERDGRRGMTEDGEEGRGGSKSRGGKGRDGRRDGGRDGEGEKGRRTSGGGTPNTKKSSTHMGSYSQSEEYSAEDVVEKAWKVENLCALCSVSKRREVVHGDEGCNVRRRMCHKCGSESHFASKCPMRPKLNSNKCYKCGIGMFRGDVVHRIGTYGRECMLEKVMMMFLVCWRDEEVRAGMKADIDEVDGFSGEAEVMKWMRGIGHRCAGVGVAADWVIGWITGME